MFLVQLRYIIVLNERIERSAERTSLIRFGLASPS
ncbi:MAG: hypothetical protein RLZZ387_4143 [Chloroflexota bacterium]|jgi:hypothetical protein